jgi:hypothetical protein
MPPPPAPTSLSDFTPSLLEQRYPHLPAWAIEAFPEIQHCSTKKQHDLPVEARALLNICILPMPGFYGKKGDIFDADVDIRPLFATKKNYDDNKRDVDLYRLGNDVGRVWKG